MNPIIAFDESGNTGQDLLDSDQPTFVLASVYFEDDEAAKLSEIFPASQRSELKFKKLKNSQSAIFEFLNSELITPEKVKISLFHKQFMIVTKIVDLLIEPLLHRRGIDLYVQGMNIALSNLHYSVMPAFCGEQRFKEFLSRFVYMIRRKDLESINNFYSTVFELIQSCEEYRYRIDLIEIFSTKEIINEILAGDDNLDLEPAIPAFVQLCYAWGNQLGREFDIIHDKSKPIKGWEEKLLCMMAKDEQEVEVGYDRRKAVLPLRATGIKYCDSAKVLQVQIADIVAGAYAYLANGRAGLDVDEALFEDLHKSKLDQLVAGAVWPDTAVTPEELGTTEMGGINIADYTSDLIARQLSKKRNIG